MEKVEKFFEDCKIENDKHLDAAIEIATVIANNPRLAVLAGKESVNQQAETPLIPGLRLERRLFHGLFGTPDQREGMAAFDEKRKPDFTKYQARDGWAHEKASIGKSE